MTFPTHSPDRAVGPRWRLRAAGFALGALLTLVLVLPAPAQPTYTFDVDPIRLGNKALEEGRLADAAARYREAVDAGYQVYKAHYGLAGIAVREGHDAEAEDLFRKALGDKVAQTGKAEFPEAHAGLGLLLLREGHPQEAAVEIDKALSEKDDLWPAQYGKARLLIAAGDTVQAKGLLDRGAKRRGVSDGEDQYHYGMALLEIARGDLDRAEKQALVAFGMNPSEPEYGTTLARIYEKKQVPSLAIDAYERALAEPGVKPTAPVLHDLGSLYREVKRYNDARDAYAHALAVDSTYAPALRDLGALYLLADQPEKAAPVYLRYVRENPGDVDVRVDLAGILLKLGDVDQAREQAQAAVAADSTRAGARAVLARAGMQSKDPSIQAAAAAEYAALPDTVTLTAEDHLLWGTWLAGAKRPDAAREQLRAAIAADSTADGAWYQLGIVDLTAGMADSAVAPLERAVALKPEEPAYGLNLGVAYLQAGRSADAVAALRRAMAGHQELTVGHVLLGQALTMSDSLAGAEKEYEKVLAAEPTNAKALRGLGFCAIRSSRFADAAKRYDEATRADPGDADGWAGLGISYLGLEKLDRAQAAFEKARSLDPNNPTLVRGWELLQKAKQGAGN